MKAGGLRHKVQIQSKTEDRTATGAVTYTWTTFASPWAAIEPLYGREYFASQQVQAEVTTRIRIRYRVGVTPDMRVLWGTRVFSIKSVINLDERNREMHLMCIEEVS